MFPFSLVSLLEVANTVCSCFTFNSAGIALTAFLVHINKHEVLHYPNSQAVDKLKLYLDGFKTAIVDFGDFLMNANHSLESHDSLLFYLNRMVAQEHQICKRTDRKCLDSILHEKLNGFKEKYEQQLRQHLPKSSDSTSDLRDVYELIQKVSEIDLIQEQMPAINEYQQNYMHKQEKRID